MGCGTGSCGGNGGSKGKAAKASKEVKRPKAYTSMMPKKMNIICNASGTTNPDSIQKS